jgi:hypothetical protein
MSTNRPFCSTVPFINIRGDHALVNEAFNWATPRRGVVFFHVSLDRSMSGLRNISMVIIFARTLKAFR